ncbi:MAG: adenylosuccinate lyase [Bacteroidota bacterium]|nr:adenylosuccinate lyase [Bacteroidota bacterium]
MNINALTAISPIDGRYRAQIENLAEYFSEFGLIKYRVLVEVEYYIALCDMSLPAFKSFDKNRYEDLRKVYIEFNEEDALAIKEIEKTTNHDVKAVEYFLKTKFDLLGLQDFKEFIHFGLTSQDINNTAIPLLLKDAIELQYKPLLYKLKDLLKAMTVNWENVTMLARTHGQPASPTRLGKELMVFVARLEQQLLLLKSIPFSAKFGGATGNFNAHYLTYPSTDWNNFANALVAQLGLKRSFPTTQIEHYDNLAAICDNCKRINNILVDLSRDIWHYVSINYFKQKIKEGEIGSSAMPHKVNPIDFENAEGNLGIANALFEHFSSKLPISRLQRDLTDSTVLRNIGVPFAHTIISFHSIIKGLNKLELNKAAIDKDLESNWAVVAEGIQTVLRREGYPQPYEALKNLTRKNEEITQSTISNFIDGLDVNDNIKNELKSISPYNYVGR